MRTTLDIDDDVLIAVKERARRERKSTGIVISALVRLALNGSRSISGSKFMIEDGLHVLAPRGDVITLQHVQKIMDEEGI